MWLRQRSEGGRVAAEWSRRVAPPQKRGITEPLSDAAGTTVWSPAHI